MNILDTIIAHKHTEVAQRKAAIPQSILEQRGGFSAPVYSLQASLRNPEKTGIIAEFKRRSPSKGIINGQADIVTVTGMYAEHGASCLSILTDETFFGGSTEDLMQARIHPLPILRKDFIIDPYQIAEAKAMGADVILLIAACLSPKQVQDLAGYAVSLGLEVLLELHDEEELHHICNDTVLVGINNRNLKTFEVDIDRSLRMAAAIPDNKIKIAESGISTAEAIRLFRSHGFEGFLIGENFMKAADPGKAFAKFVHELKNASSQD